MRPIDLTGKTFGRLTVLCRAEDHVLPCGQRQRQWKCQCTCGREVIVRGVSLREGATQSCGCLKSELDKMRWQRARAAYEKRTGKPVGYKHGESFGPYKTRLYRIWLNMKNRCSNPKGADYSRYGGRGIEVCPEWRESFEAFREWALSHGYRDDLSIDRIDNEGNYEPENCRWATAHEQRINQNRMKK